MYLLSKSLQAVLWSSLFLSSVFASGDLKPIFLFKDVLESNYTALTTSGFDTLVIFRVGVLATGDLVYYATGSAAQAVTITAVSNGTYVGGAQLANKIKSYKTGNTTVNRVEVSLVSADTTFVNIENLINTEGVGPTTILYQNFKALKAAWTLDAVNNDDESNYDVPSTLKFAEMLGTIGYKYTSAPYTNLDFWSTVGSSLNETNPGMYDRLYLQCYDGGENNDPGEWQDVLDMKIVPLLWVTNDDKPEYGNTPALSQIKFANWSSLYSVAGGGYWNDYDIERMNSSYTLYADALLDVFG
ncbi:putative coagulation factor 5 type-containing protein [Coleophoma cylindrospora]|uniref:Putative coagulation factor 5 type-containing protein n=1 Tax=Coleophoma cylindrospora TaxID=1849047 RepID=A0A3D8Q4M1_9HELO|nr:putative coagulation factor 5 type-containing protein [Coleophoma cylindrospora]